MFPITTFQGKAVAVFGLARSGITAALALEAGGAIVYAWDDSEKARQNAQTHGLEVKDLNDVDFAKLSALVMTPGVAIYGPKIHWAAIKAQDEELPIIGDIELFARQINSMRPDERPKIIGITGTNGKSTTTSLIAHILTHAGKNVQIGGNIGTGVLSLDPPSKNTYYVLELSSYQLDLTKSLRLNVAVLINVSEDHLERHSNMSRYVAAKRNIFANQTPQDTAIIGVDDEWGEAQCTKLFAGGSREIIPVSSGQYLGAGISAIGRSLWDNQSGRAIQVADLSLAKSLPGAHNGQNAAAAFACCRALGLSAQTIAAGLYSFGGLSHRLQEVGRIGNVRFFNDSKATNADAASQALSAFDKIRWIAGGRAKTGGIEQLRPLFGRVASAYLIGEAAEDFAKTLGSIVPHKDCKTMDMAVKAAFNDALQTGGEEFVVLSPACASFDQYPDFEARGNDFVRLVNALVDEMALG